MMPAAKRNSEFVADLATKRSLLCEAQMMGIGWYSAAQQARLVHDRPYMLSITNTSRFGQVEYTLVDSVSVQRRVRLLLQLMRLRRIRRFVSSCEEEIFVTRRQRHQLGTKRLFYLLSFSCSQGVLLPHRTVRPNSAVIA